MWQKIWFCCGDERSIFEMARLKDIAAIAIAVYLALIAMAYTLPEIDRLLGVMP